MLINVISDIYKVIVSVCFQVLPTQKWDFSHTLMMPFNNASHCLFLYQAQAAEIPRANPAIHNCHPQNFYCRLLKCGSSYKNAISKSMESLGYGTIQKVRIRCIFRNPGFLNTPRSLVYHEYNRAGFHRLLDLSWPRARC
jgi:hypothetical protein